jgi:hypothetical protein
VQTEPSSMPTSQQGLTTTLTTIGQTADKYPAPRGLSQGDSKVRVFPHCPRCSSFYLYRRNNVGNYECQTCEMRDIPADVARRPHRA